MGDGISVATSYSQVAVSQPRRLLVEEQKSQRQPVENIVHVQHRIAGEFGPSDPGMKSSDSTGGTEGAILVGSAAPVEGVRQMLSMQLETQNQKDLRAMQDSGAGSEVTLKQGHSMEPPMPEQLPMPQIQHPAIRRYEKVEATNAEEVAVASLSAMV